MATIVETRFRSNLDRVRGLIAARDQLSTLPSTAGVSHADDILRAAVVMLHASLEDVLRTVAAERLPATTKKDVLKEIPFPGDDERRTKFTLGDLAEYRGRSVSELIAEAVGSYLNRVSYNSPDDIARSLWQIDLSPDLVKPFAAHLDAIMRRRHHIVHRVDISEAPSTGRHSTRRLEKSTVEGWVQVVSDFGEALLKVL